MNDNTPDNQGSAALLKVLTAHYQALVSARSDKNILRQYASLLRALRSKSLHLLGQDEGPKTARNSRSRPLSAIRAEELHEATLDDLEKLVTDSKTIRKDLELIAIQRFSVPRGSMRKFANREMLVDKLRTLIGNERSHEAIGVVAREQAKRT
jgi:hypothetical protein